MLAWNNFRKRQNIEKSSFQGTHQAMRETWDTRHMVNPTTASAPTDVLEYKEMHPVWNPSDFQCSGDRAESLRRPREAEFTGKSGDLYKVLLKYSADTDPHIPIRKWPERMRNNNASPHTKSRIVLLPSRQTEIPQNSKRTGQSTQKVQGSVVGNH